MASLSPPRSSPCSTMRSPPLALHRLPHTLRTIAFPSPRRQLFPLFIPQSLPPDPQIWFWICNSIHAASHSVPFAVSARLYVRANLQPDENYRCSLTNENSGGLWPADLAISSQLLDAGAAALLQDWRADRPRLFGAPADQLDKESCREGDAHWGHEIPFPEAGCILLATENLDRHPLLRKSVILLLNSNGRSFCGVIMNRTLPFPTEEIWCVDQGVDLGLRSCPTFLGGPLHTASSFHLLSPHLLQGFETVRPGIHVGREQSALFASVNSIRRQRIAAEELRVYIGQMEWDARSLSAEIVVLRWWKIVSCSCSLLRLQDVNSMWSKIHHLVTGCRAAEDC